MTENNQNDCDSLKNRLQKMERIGIRLYLDGAPASPEHIAKCCVNEEMLYMPDYVADKEGKIREIRYDRISLK